MSDTETYRNHIMEITTNLLNEFNGDTKKITSRMIADKAGIGLGSINHFFGSKEHLITECIQKIINKMLAGFAPDLIDSTKNDGLSDQTRLISWAVQTFDFLFDNQAIARISILSDMQNYSADSNSAYTQKGFAFAIKNNQDWRRRQLLVFILVSAMQTAFLAKDSAKEIIGYDFTSKTERDSFISDTVTMLLHNTEDIPHEI